MSRKKNTKTTANGRVRDSIKFHWASDVICEQLGRLNLLDERLCPDKKLEDMTLFEKNIAYMAETAHTELVALMLRLKVLAGFCEFVEDNIAPDEETLPPDPFDEQNPDPLEWIIENRTVWEGYEEEMFPSKEINGTAKISKDGKIFFEPDNG